MTYLKYPTISFRVTKNMSADLASRITGVLGSQHAVAKRDLERYYDLLRQELRVVSFSQAEMMLMLDVSRSTLGRSFFIPMLWKLVEDSLHGGMAEKWDVDGAGLVARLQDLTTAQAFAVVDALERALKMGGDLEAAGRHVGLIRGEMSVK